MFLRNLIILLVALIVIGSAASIIVLIVSVAVSGSWFLPLLVIGLMAAFFKTVSFLNKRQDA